VADFIGQVTFIDGIWQRSSGNVTTDFGQTFKADLELADGPVRLVIRPENVRLAEVNAANAANGTLVEMVRQTGTTTYQVQLPQGPIVKARQLGLSEGRLQPGAAIGLQFDTCKLAFSRT
jgi:ABC-type Fe3+/spermidine/putrescine transport system ATPase subunit